MAHTLETKTVKDIAANTGKRSIRDFIMGAVIASMGGPWIAEFLANFSEFLQGQMDAGVLPPIVAGMLLMGLRWLRDYLKHCTTADQNKVGKILIPVLLAGVMLSSCATVRFVEVVGDNKTKIVERVFVVPGTTALTDHSVDYEANDWRLRVGQKATLENHLEEALVDFGEIAIRGFEHYLSAGAPQFWYRPDSEVEEGTTLLDVIDDALENIE